MLSPEVEAAIASVPWADLRSTYGSGEVVRDVLVALASPVDADARSGWDLVLETVLQHQQTVFSATVRAAPIMAMLAGDERTLYRAALISELPALALGKDAPNSPAGTAWAVRDALAPAVPALLEGWDRSDRGVRTALVALTVAFPQHADLVLDSIRSWFVEADDPVRHGLGLALYLHGDESTAVAQVVLDEVSHSPTWTGVAGRIVKTEIAPHGLVQRDERARYLADAVRIARRLREEKPVSVASLGPLWSLYLIFIEMTHRTFVLPGLAD